MAAEEAVTNEVVASAHVENYGVKLFLWADKEDRASHFNKNVVKAFYSAGILFDVLTIFYRQTTFHLEDCPKPMSFFVNPV